MAGAHPQEIDAAFAANSDLRKRVHAAIDQNPKQSTLFRDISNYILGQSTSQQPSTSEPATKKRKLEESNGTAQNGTASEGGIGSLASADIKAWKSYPGTSFSLPQRKKFTLEIVSGKEGGIRGTGADGKVEFGIAWKDVDQIFCLPVPEKAKRQHNFVVLPLHGDGVNPVPDHLKSSPPEPIIWTFEEATGKNIVAGVDPGPEPLAGAIEQAMKQAGLRKSVIFPGSAEFESAIVQSHRKGEKAYHVKAHRGSKEGFLYLTSVGIIFGFKKPLAYFEFATVNSVSFTNVLRNTFNLVISTPSQDIEFGMIDQADYAGINEYVQNHKLQDASLAEQRRAKKLNVNPPAQKENGANGAAAEEDDGETELQKAERQLEDEEDEDEEDYDPGSEGDSEGSGTDDSEDDEDGEGGDYDEEEEEEEEGEGEGEGEDEGQEVVKAEPQAEAADYDEPEYEEAGAEEMEYDEPV